MDFDRTRCTVCGYDEVAAIASYEKIPASIVLARFLRRPITPAGRPGIPWRRPLLAACLGIVIIGAGHIYVGKLLHGAVYMAAAVILTWSIYNISLLAIFFLAVIWEWQTVEAYDHAVEFNWSSIMKNEGRGR